MSQMSQSEQDLAEQAISLVLTLRKETYCAVAASALVLFDHFSTVIREIEYMWRRPVKIPTILFLVNRWTMLTWAAVILIGIFMPVSSTTGCAVIGYLTDAVSMVLFVLWGAFSTIRINAVSLNNWPLTLVVFMVSMAPAGTNAWVYFADASYIHVDIPYLDLSCDTVLKRSLQLNVRLSIVTRICIILSDAIVLAVICAKTHYTFRRDTRLGHIRTPITTTLLRDGALYFIVSLIINVFILAGWIKESAFGLLTFPLSSMIMSHVLLNLRQVAYSGDGSDATNRRASHSISAMIASYLGPLDEAVGSGSDIPHTNVNEQECQSDVLQLTRASGPQTIV